jgi:hypothetical protein
LTLVAERKKHVGNVLKNINIQTALEKYLGAIEEQDGMCRQRKP